MAKRILVMGGEAVRNHAKGPVTKHVLKRLEENPPPEDIRAMPTVEADLCILCGTCERVCPTHCLEVTRDDKDNGMILLHTPQCMICGHCETYCPKDCIHVSGSDPLHFSFDNRTDYKVICAKGEYVGEKAEKRLKKAIESGEKLKSELPGYKYK